MCALPVMPVMPVERVMPVMRLITTGDYYYVVSGG